MFTCSNHSCHQSRWVYRLLQPYIIPTGFTSTSISLSSFSYIYTGCCSAPTFPPERVIQYLVLQPSHLTSTHTLHGARVTHPRRLSTHPALYETSLQIILRLYLSAMTMLSLLERLESHVLGSPKNMEHPSLSASQTNMKITRCSVSARDTSLLTALPTSTVLKMTEYLVIEAAKQRGRRLQLREHRLTLSIAKVNYHGVGADEGMISISKATVLLFGYLMTGQNVH